MLSNSSTQNERLKTLTKQKNTIGTLHLKDRLLDFIKSNDTSSLLESYKGGSYPLVNPALHCHRERVKELELEPFGEISTKNFSLAKDRAEQSRAEFVNSHLEIELYDQSKPHQRHDKWVRVRNLQKEGPPVRHKFRTENEDIAQILQKQLESLDTEKRNMKMVHNSCWKDPVKSKWIEPQKGFVAGKKDNVRSHVPWPQVPLLENEVYLGGYKETEENMLRKRIKQKEHNRNEFISRIRNDPWETTLHLSSSIRTLKSDEAMSAKADQRLFSLNKKLDSSSYKQSLVTTGSIDHFLPFNHSNNFQSLKLKDIVQIFPRNYKNSLVHYGLNQFEPNPSSKASSFPNQLTTGGSFSSKKNSKPQLTLGDMNLISPIPAKKELQSDQQSLSTTAWNSPQNESKNMTLNSPSKIYSKSLDKMRRQSDLVVPKYTKKNPPPRELISEIVSSYFKTCKREEQKN